MNYGRINNSFRWSRRCCLWFGCLVIYQIGQEMACKFMIDLNAGIFVFGVLVAIAVVFLIYTETLSGKEWIKNL